MRKISLDIENETYDTIQKFADEKYEGKFAMGIRFVLKKGLEK